MIFKLIETHLYAIFNIKYKLDYEPLVLWYSALHYKKHICHFKDVKGIRYLQVLTFGQAYQITLQLDMPDSETNQEIGMFMIRTTCFSRDGGQVATSARSVSGLPSPPFGSHVCMFVLTLIDSLLRCCVFLRQGSCHPPPALVL